VIIIAVTVVKIIAKKKWLSKFEIEVVEVARRGF